MSADGLRASSSEILEKIGQRAPLTRSEVIGLFSFEGEEAEALFGLARSVRGTLYGPSVTVSRNVFLPITHACRNRCGYCTYRTDPADGASALMSPDEVLRVAEQGDALGCREALFMAGDKPEKASEHVRSRLRHFGFGGFFEYACHLMELVLRHTRLIPHSNLGVMTAGQMRRLKETNGSIGLMLENVSARLTLPGEAHYMCPEKYPNQRLRMIREAGQLRIPFTTGLLIGIGETVEEVVDSLIAIYRLHQEGNHIQEIILQNFGPKEGTAMAGKPEPEFSYLKKTIAVARILFDGGMHIQSPPNLNRSRMSGLLSAGIDDFGGISPVTRDYVNPGDPWPDFQELDGVCRDQGLVLRERLPVYPEYAGKDSRWLPGHLQTKIEGLTDPNGYVRTSQESTVPR